MALMHYGAGGHIQPRDAGYGNYGAPVSNAYSTLPTAPNADGSFTMAQGYQDPYYPWSHYFGGAPNSNVPPPPPYSQGYYSLPEAYTGKNKSQAVSMINRLTKEDTVWLRTALPVTIVENSMNYKFEQWRFDQTSMDREPEVSTSRMITSHKTSKSGGMIRHGKCIELEHGFMKTPMGAIQLQMGILQLQQAALVTMVMGALVSLLQVPHNLSYRNGVPTNSKLTNKEFEQLIEQEIDMWAVLQKDTTGFAFDRLFNFYDDILLSRGVSSRERLVALPRGTRSWINQAPESTEALRSGKPSVPEGSQITNKYGQVIESRPLDTGDGRDPNADPLFQERSVGTFFTMPASHVKDLHGADYKSRYRNIRVYDEDYDEFREISLKTAVENCGMFYPAAPYGLTREGKKFYGFYGNWFKLLDAHGMVDKWVAAILDMSAQSRADLFAALSATPPGNGPVVVAGMLQAPVFRASGPDFLADVRRYLPNWFARWRNTLIFRDAWALLTAGRGVRYNITEAEQLVTAREELETKSIDTYLRERLAWGANNGLGSVITSVAFGVNDPIFRPSGSGATALYAELGCSGLSAGAQNRIVEDHVALLADATAYHPAADAAALRAFTTGVMAQVLRRLLNPAAHTAAKPAFGDRAFTDAYQQSIELRDPIRFLEVDQADANHVHFLEVLRTYANQLLHANVRLAPPLANNNRPQFWSDDFKAKYWRWVALCGAWYMYATSQITPALRATSMNLLYTFMQLSSADRGSALLTQCGTISPGADDVPAVKVAAAAAVDGFIQTTHAAFARAQAVASHALDDIEVVLAAAATTAAEKNQRIRGLLKSALITNGAPLFICMDNDIPVPISLLLVRPHQAYRMGSGIMMIPGRETGETMVGHADMMWTDDAVLKMHYGHFTLYFASVVKQEQNVVVMNNIFCKEPMGGAGTKFWKPTARTVTEYLSGYGNGRSLFSVVVPPDWTPSSNYLDITGRYNPAICAESNDNTPAHYPTAALYTALWGWAHGEDKMSPLKYFNKVAPRYNTVCAQGFQFMYEWKGPNVGSFTHVVMSKDHFGDPYPGCKAWRRGARRGPEPVNYNYTNVVKVV